MDNKSSFETLSPLPSPHDDPVRERNATLNEYLDIFRRRRIIILQVFALVFTIGVVVTLFTIPIYRATAYLLIEAPSVKVNAVDASNPLAEIFSANQAYKIETQVRLLQGKSLIASTEKKIGSEMPELTVKSIRDTEIIEVATEGPDAKLVANAANTLLATYLDEVADVNGQQVKQALKFTQAGANKARNNLEKTERELRDFKRKYKVAEMNKDRETQIAVVNQLTNRYDELQTKLASARAQIDATKSQLAAEPQIEPTTTENAADAAVLATETQLVGLEAERAGLLRRYTPINQKVAEVDARIAVLRKQLAAQRKLVLVRNVRRNPAYDALRDRLLKLEAEASGLATEAATTAGRLLAERQRLNSFPSWELELARLQRELDTSKANYAMFTTKLEDLRLRDQTRRVNARIMEMAEPPTIPVRPNRVQNIVFAAFLGMILGLGLALLQEYLDDRINSIDEAHRVLQLPHLGLIPQIEEEGLRRLRSTDSFSPIAEAYRSLRTNLNFASVDNPVRTLMVTSTSPGEGKSTTAVNLAAVMAMEGRRVIVVDGDLRRPTIHKQFKTSQSPGLTDVLVGTHTLSQVLRPTDVPNVQMISAGTSAPNPSELLGSEAMAHFVDALRDLADIILFDAPPTLAVADSPLLSSRVDGVVFVISFGETKRTHARQALEMLARARANLLGVVLNKVDETGMAYYGKYLNSYAPVPAASSNPGNPRSLAHSNGSEPALTEEKTVPEEKV